MKMARSKVEQVTGNGMPCSDANLIIPSDLIFEALLERFDFSFFKLLFCCCHKPFAVLKSILTHISRSRY